MTYIVVKLVCLFVLFVAFEIGTEAQNLACYGEICSNYVIYQLPSYGTLYPLKCCGPKAKCQRCCRHQHCPMGQICRYFFSIHRSAISVTSEAAEVVEVNHLRIKIVTWNFTVTFLGISTVYPLMTMTMAGSGDEAFGINLKKKIEKNLVKIHERILDTLG